MGRESSRDQHCRQASCIKAPAISTIMCQHSSDFGDGAGSLSPPRAIPQPAYASFALCPLAAPSECLKHVNDIAARAGAFRAQLPKMRTPRRPQPPRMSRRRLQLALPGWSCSRRSAMRHVS
jgi:hypothetical protein